MRSTPLLHLDELRRGDQEREQEHKGSVDKQFVAGRLGCGWTKTP
jgi:hypothetical protein